MPTISAQAKKHSPLVKLGWVIVASGLGVTTIAAVLLAQGQTSYELAADFVHRFGMFAMLAGLVVLLIGYRVPMFKKLWNMIREATKMQTTNFRGAEATAGERQNPRAITRPERNVPIVIGGLIVTLALAGIAGLFVLFLPLHLSMLMAAIVNSVLPALLTVTLVYSRGYLRAFSIGALFPATMTMVAAWVRMLPMLLAGTVGFGNNYGYGWGGGYGGPQEFEFRMLVLCQWAVIAIIGALSMGLRLFLAISQLGENDRRDAQ